MTHLTLTILYPGGERKTFSASSSRWDMTTQDMIDDIFKPVLMAAGLPGAEDLGLIPKNEFECDRT
jgi:hypothetical protein